MSFRKTLFFACLLLGAYACEIKASQAQSTGFLGLSIGYFGALQDDKAIDFRAEYRPDSHVFLKGLKPWMGLQLTTDATLWAGGGLLYDFELSPKWRLTPSLGVGYYAQGHSDLDLGHPIEFRTQLELAYEFSSGQRAALAFSHMSNAGLSDDNPGTEVIGLYWHIPLGKF